MSDRDWCVMRQDDNGQRYLVVTELTEAEARLLAVSYAARGHKQLYWVEPMPAADPAPADPEPRQLPTLINDRETASAALLAALPQRTRTTQPRMAAMAPRTARISEPRAAVGIDTPLPPITSR